MVTTTSWTEISTFRMCPHKHKLQYIDRWKAPKLSRPLTLGILWHTILEHHYGGIKEHGVPHVDLIVELLNQFGARDPNHPHHEIGATALWMYHGYKRWADMWDREWRIREVEVEFRVPLPNSDIVLVGRVDLVIEYRRHMWVIDHKAVKNLPYGKELDLDDQTPLYIWGMRQAGYDCRGAILSHTRTHKLKTREMDDDERFSRDWIYRTDDELDMVVQEATASIEAAYDPNQRHPRHPDPQSCKWRCPYLEPCIGGRKAPHLEVELLNGLGFERSYPRPVAIS